MLNTAEAGQQFRPWPPWSMGQLAPQETRPEEGGKQARGQPLLGLHVCGTWLEGHSAPLSPEPAPLCRAAIPLQGRPLREAGASLSWAALPTDHSSKATQHHCLPRACPLPAPGWAEIPTGEAPRGGGAVAEGKRKKRRVGQSQAVGGRMLGHPNPQKAEFDGGARKPQGGIQVTRGGPMAVPEVWGGDGVGRRTHRPGGVDSQGPGWVLTGDVGWGAHLEACRITGHQHLSGFLRVNLEARSGLMNKGQSGKHISNRPACPEGTTSRAQAPRRGPVSRAETRPSVVTSQPCSPSRVLYHE